MRHIKNPSLGLGFFMRASELERLLIRLITAQLSCSHVAIIKSVELLSIVFNS